MPRKIPLPRKGTKEIQGWCEDQMKLAIAAIRNKTMGYKRAVKMFGVPRTTLRRLARDSTVSLDQSICKTLGRKPIFPRHLEEKLVKYLLVMERCYFGLTYMDIRRLAYQFAIKNNVQTPFKDGSAGRAWLDHFLNRHKNKLSMKKPGHRVQEGSWTLVNEFFNMLNTEYNKKSYTPDRIFNVDVTGLTIAQSKMPTVIARKGRQQIVALRGFEMEYLITVVCAMNAEGKFIPPMMIYPRTSFTNDMMKGAPPGAIGRIHPSGWIYTNLFTDWFIHFIQEIKPTEESPAILLLDGNYLHTRNIEVFELAEQNHVTILSVPPYTSHKLNPLDRSFMGPLRSQYTEEVRNFIAISNRYPQTSEITELFGTAYMKCATSSIALEGFKDTGIYPYDRTVFSSNDFPFSSMVDSSQLNECERGGTSSASVNQPPNTIQVPETEIIEQEIKSDLDALNKPSTSRENYEILSDVSDSDYDDSMDESTTEDNTPYNDVIVDKITDDKKGQVWVHCQSCNMWWAHDKSKSTGAVKEYSICDFCR